MSLQLENISKDIEEPIQVPIEVPIEEPIVEPIEELIQEPNIENRIEDATVRNKDCLEELIDNDSEELSTIDIYEEFNKFIEPYKSNCESLHVIYGGCIWRVERSFDRIYLYDHFETYVNYRYDGEVDYSQKTITFKSTNTENNTLQKNQFNDFIEKAIWLKNDLDDDTIHKIHLELLKTHVKKYHCVKYSRADIVALEAVYRSRLETYISNRIDSISKLIYSAAFKGYCAIKVSFDINKFTLTESYKKEINFTIPNSDGIIRKSLDVYVPYLLKEIIEKWSGHSFNEILGKELLVITIEKMLIHRYPHLKINIDENGTIMPIFEIRFLDSVESCLA
jgi:spore coat protein CotF